MPEYTVKSANVKKTFPSKDGKGDVQVVALVLTDNDGDQPAELLVFPGTNAPNAGDKVNGTLEPNGDYAPKFKRARAYGGGGGGPRPEDPKKAAHIARMHAQGVAVHYAGVLQGIGPLPEDFNLAQLKQIVDWFEKDARASRYAA